MSSTASGLRSRSLAAGPEQGGPGRRDLHPAEAFVHLDGPATKTGRTPRRWTPILAKKRSKPPGRDGPLAESTGVPALTAGGGGWTAPEAPPPEMAGGKAGDAGSDCGGAVVEEVDGEEDVGEVCDGEGDHAEEGGLGAGWGEVGVEVCEGEGELAAVEDGAEWAVEELEIVGEWVR